ncbi:MAG: hypothetical protein AB8F95_00495 [Bacteroidia bacterium]
MIRFIIGILISLISIGFAKAESSPMEQIEQAMLHLKLDKAVSLTQELDSEGYQGYYQTNILLYRYLTIQSSADLEKFREAWKPAIDALEALSNKDPLKGIMIAELYGKRAALEFLDGKNLKAVNLVRTCHKLIQQNVKRFPQDQSQNKLLGLFNVVFAAVPKKYQWITNMLGYKGNMDLGMRQLAAAAYYGELLPLEAELIAYYVEKNTLGRPDLAIRRMEKARDRHGAGMLTDFLLASAYGVENKGEEALAILEQGDRYGRDESILFIPFWDYVQGKSYYYKEDHRQAKAAFERFLGATEGNIYKVDATFRLGMTEVFLNENTAAKQRFQDLLSYEISPFDEDSYAQQLARQFAITLPEANLQLLFRARNRFDGGYFKEARRLLAQLDVEALSPGEKTEWYYRSGRVEHALLEYDTALESYRSAVSQPDAGEARWMQAYASYYMGEIARKQGKKEDAKAYYRTALGFDKYYYQSGLENRVKAALGSL